MTITHINLAVFANDVYFREYGSPPGSGVTGNQVGAAIFQTHIGSNVTEATYQAWQAEGFYASAYIVGSEIVISFRGSDNSKDIANNAAFIAGGLPKQALLAVQFYDHIKAAHPGVSIVMTGHSLGGALAGTVAAVRGATAVTFDNAGYTLTANFIHAGEK